MASTSTTTRLLRVVLLSVGGLLLALLVAALIFSWAVNRQVDAYQIYTYSENAPGQYLKISGYDMHYRLVGDPLGDPTGAPLLLIHGFASSSDEFERLAPLLADSRSLVMPDLLGFGHSQRPVEPMPAYTHRGQAALLAELLDQLGVGQVDLLGASYGGGIAAQFALDNPERARRIVFLDAEVFGEGGGNAWVAYLPFGLDRAMTWYALGGGPVAQTLVDLACYDLQACTGDGALDAARQRITRIQGTAEALIAFSRTTPEKRIPQDFPLLKADALVIWGAQDEIIPPENGERLAELLDAPLETIPQVGHTPHIERPALVAPLVLGFLQ